MKRMKLSENIVKTDPYLNKIVSVIKFEGRDRAICGVSLDDAQRIYVADIRGNVITVFSNEGYFITRFGREVLTRPKDVSVQRDCVYVRNYYPRYTILKISEMSAKIVQSKVQLGWRGMAVDRNGNLFVACSVRGAIVAMTSELKHISLIGKSKLKQPHDVRIYLNNLFVSDQNDINNIHIFSMSGELLKSYIQFATGSKHISFCIDSLGNIIAGEWYSNLLKIFNIEGKLIHQLTCARSVRGIAVTDNLRIICACNNVIIVY